MTPKQKADIMAMNRDGLSIEEIAAATGKKEPAQAATCTDSEAVIGNDNTNSLCLNDTTDRAESQALEAAKKKLLEIYETLTPDEVRAWELGEVYAEVVRGCGE